MRKIIEKIIHCSLSDSPVHDDISVIDRWHKEKGWKGVLHQGKRIYCGYHYFIKGNGKLQYGRPLANIGAHCLGHNKNSIGICLHGINKFSSAQFKTLRYLCESLDFVIGSTPEHGHNEFANRDCPNFNVKDILK